MSEYIVKGAEPNETVLHTRTPNGYEEWRWLPVREEIVRCRDCKYAKTTLQGIPAERVLVCTAHLRYFPTSDDGFCHLGRRMAE